MASKEHPDIKYLKENEITNVLMTGNINSNSSLLTHLLTRII